MKKSFYLLMLLAACLCGACSSDDGDGGSQLEISNQEQLTQTAYADESSTGGGFTFSAKSAWTAEVTETPAKSSKEAAAQPGSNRLPWLSLNAYSGAAGSHTLQITLLPNYTGETRAAKIEIICGDDKITISVTQESKTEKGETPEDPNPVTSILISADRLKMEVGSKAMLIASVQPENATIKTVTWKSSNPKIATVGELTGEVTAIAAGEAVITAISYSDPEITATCAVTVVGLDEGNVTPESVGRFAFGDVSDYKLESGGIAHAGDYYRNGTTCVMLSLHGPEINGGYSYESILGFNILIPEGEQLTAGTYNYSADREEGTFTAESYIQFDDGSQYPLTGRLVIKSVNISDVIWCDVFFELEIPDGKTVIGSYTGQMGLDGVDPRSYTTRSPALDAWLVENYVAPGYNSVSWVELPNITEIDFPYTGSGEKISGVLHLHQFPNLQVVNLSGHAIEVIGGGFNIGVKSGPLRRLDLSNNALKDLDITYQNNLEFLNCSGNSLLATIVCNASHVRRYNQDGANFIKKDTQAEFFQGVGD